MQMSKLMNFLKSQPTLYYFSEIFSLFLFMVLSMSLEFLPPNQRIPDINDKSIGFPHTKFEIVSALMLPMFNMGIPAFLLLSIACINRFKNKNILTAILGLFFTISLAFLITNIFKSPIGRLRPDFLSRCIPDPNLLPMLIVCTGNVKIIEEGRRSFPSGHASSTFAGLGFISLFFSAHFNLFDGSGRLYKLIIFLIPLLTATLISISRIVDYRHHWDDVLAGGIIGCSSALTGYFYFYPLLFESSITESKQGISQALDEGECV